MGKKDVHQAIVLSKEEAELERIRAIESALHERAAHILACSMRAPEIKPDADECPPDWDPTDFAIAKAAWLSQKEAPTFLKTAQAFLSGSMKVRAHENSGPKILNATIVQTTAPLPVFPERTVKRDEDE